MINDETDGLQKMCISDSHDRRPGVTVIFFHDHGPHTGSEGGHKDQNKDQSDRCLLFDAELSLREGDGTRVLEATVNVLDLSDRYTDASKKNDSDIHKFAEELALVLDKEVGSGKDPVIVVGEGFGGHIIKHVLLTLARLASQWVEEDTYNKENLRILLERVQGIFYYYHASQDSRFDCSGLRAVSTEGLPEEFRFSSRETSASMTRVSVDFKKFRTMRKIKTYALVQGSNFSTSQADATGLESVVPFDVDSYKTAPTLENRSPPSELYSFIKSVLVRQKDSGKKTVTHRKPSAVATSETASGASQGIQC